MNSEDKPAQSATASNGAIRPPDESLPEHRQTVDGTEETHDAPPPDADLKAVAEEAATVREAAEGSSATDSTPPRGAPADRVFLSGAVLLALLLLFGWIGGATIWQVRRDVAALDARVVALQESVQTGESAQAQAALLRALAELQALRASLPEPLAKQVAEAEHILAGISPQLTASS